jgi:hypothetical protein
MFPVVVQEWLPGSYSSAEPDWPRRVTSTLPSGRSVAVCLARPDASAHAVGNKPGQQTSKLP